MTNQMYQEVIEACMTCTSSCNQAAVSCLEEKEVQSLTKSIRIALENAVVCQVTAELLNLNSKYSGEICRLCATVCGACAEEFEKHKDIGLEPCKDCAEVCKTCAEKAKSIYEGMKEYPEGSEASFISNPNECTAISRAAATLMSLGSPYANTICQLNTIICNEAAAALEKDMDMEIRNSKICASISNEALQHAEFQKPAQKIEGGEVPKEDGHLNSLRENYEMKKKHSAALLAASLWRSPSSRFRSRERLKKLTNPFWTSYPNKP